MIQLYPLKTQDSGLGIGKPPVKKPAELEVVYFYAYFTMEPLSHQINPLEQLLGSTFCKKLL